METKRMVCVVMFRLLLPLVLLGATIFRFNLFSLSYGCLLLVEPLLRVPTPNSMSSHTGRYLITVLVVSALFLTAQIVFQSVLLAEASDNAPYGTSLPNCSTTENILRNIGLQRLEPNDMLNILRVVLPDIVMLITSIVVYAVCRKLTPEPQPIIGQDLSTSGTVVKTRIGAKISTFRRIMGNFMVALFLAASGIAYPSVISSVYLITFLCLVTWLSCFRTLGKKFAILRICLLVYCALHLGLLYLYQFQFFQDALNPATLIARILGMTSIVRTDCHKPWLLEINENVTWPMYVSPAVILCLYFTLACETRKWCNKITEVDKDESLHVRGTTRPTRRASSNSERQVLAPHSQTQKDEKKALVNEGSSRNYQSITSEGGQADGETEQEGDDQGPKERGMFSTVYYYVASQSYVGTLIVMMAWSITYHSWLTFVMLLGACIIWMIPQKRYVCHMAMPVILLYAIALLLIQFIYGLDLEAELPVETSHGYPYKEIGLIRYQYPCVPLAVQIAFMCVFWMTLRQCLRERKLSNQWQATPGTMELSASENGSPRMSLKRASSVEYTDNQLITNMGTWLWHILCKYWILIASSLFLVMAIQEAVVYRIIYMFLFLYFVITFQICYRWWRWTIYVFWWVVIVYSMIVLCTIYTYQFQNFPEYWHNSTGLSFEILRDIGLQQFDTATLFVKLLTPTSFLIIIILQLHYFQRTFLRISDINRYLQEEEEEAQDEVDQEPGPSGEGNEQERSTSTTSKPKKSLFEKFVAHFKVIWNKGSKLLDRFSHLLWRGIEVHIFKAVAVTVMMVCVEEVCAVNVIFMIFLVIGVPIPQLQQVMSYVTLIWTAIIVLAKMFYQLSSIEVQFWLSNCTTVKNVPANESLPAPFDEPIDTADYFGLEKTGNLPYYLRNYIALIVILACEGIVRVHQRQYYAPPHMKRPLTGIIFPNIKREDADTGLISCAKFMVNYCFYKYGLQLCFIMTVVTMAVRMDAYSVIYGLFLGVLLLFNRRSCYIVWPVYIIILGLLLFLQYLSCLGVPPVLCFEYPWVEIEEITRNLQIYLYLPNYIHPPMAVKLVADFFQLLFVALQWRVFYIENTSMVTEYGGGDNKDIIEDVENNVEIPVDDFLSCKDSYLDYVKTAIFMYMYWAVLIIVFIAGTTRISLFCLGYLLGTFFFLWLGQELLIKPLRRLLRLWGFLVGYCYFVLMCKCALQLVGCVYISSLSHHSCWVVQLFSIVCLHTGKYEDVTVTGRCSLPEDEAGVAWDATCFVFLLLQLRIYKSHYFRHVVMELKIQNDLAARGADLINRRLIHRVEERKLEEQNILSSLKRKMERIKLRQARLQERTPLLDSDDHYVVIRSGDYFMFEDDSDSEESSSVGVDTIAIGQDVTPSADSKVGPLEIINTAWTGGAKEALEKADRRKSVVSASKDDQDGGEQSPTKSPTEEDDGTVSETGEGEEKKESLCTRIINHLKLAWRVFGGFLDYLIGILEDISKDHREVAHILDTEKAEEKKKMRENMTKTPPGASVVAEGEDNTTAAIKDSDEKQILPVVDPEGVALDVPTTSDGQQSPESKTAEDEFKESTPRLFQLAIALFDTCMAQSAVVCYFLMILNVMVSASLLSLPYPFSVFLWAMLSVPRPSKTYWITVITYTEAVVVVKYLFQFGFFPWNSHQPTGDEDSPFWPPRIIGIEKKDNYAGYDLVLLFALFIHRSVLRRFGLWKHAEDIEADLAKAEEDEIAASRAASPATSPTGEAPALTFSQTVESSAELEASIEAAEMGQQKQKRKKKKKSGGICDMCWQPFRNFYLQMTNPKFNAATDVYAVMFLCDFILFFIIVFGYKSFSPDAGSGTVVTAVIQENKVPVPFLIMLLAQFVLIILDRAFFLRKNVFGKFIFQIVLVIFVHIWMFFILPAITHISFTKNTPAQLWYFVKCVYFGLSAYQIRSGYPTRILGNFLTKKYNYTNLICFKVFLAIPFLLELRALMDWIWTDTTLALTSWLEMEDIYSSIFQLKCYRTAEARYPTPRGQKRKLVVKYGMGGLILFVLIFIIWFPLLIFSLADSVLYVSNPPIDCTVQVQLGGYEPIFLMSAQQQFLKGVNGTSYHNLERAYEDDSDATAFLSAYKPEDITEVIINGESTAVWGISPPSEQALLDDLRKNTTIINLYLSISFTRSPKPGMQSETVKAQFITPLDPSNPDKVLVRQQFADMIEGNDRTEKVIMENLLPPFIRVPVSGNPTKIDVLNEEQETKTSFVLKRQNETIGDKHWWKLREYMSENPFNPRQMNYHWNDDLIFVAFNDRVAPAGLTIFTGYGIIGLYISLVLVIGRFIRMSVINLSPLIMFKHLPNVDRLLKLMLNIYMVREMQEFHLEEELYAKLLFYYRSTETMIKETRRKPKED